MGTRQAAPGQGEIAAERLVAGGDGIGHGGEAMALQRLDPGGLREAEGDEGLVQFGPRRVRSSARAGGHHQAKRGQAVQHGLEPLQLVAERVGECVHGMHVGMHEGVTIEVPIGSAVVELSRSAHAARPGFRRAGSSSGRIARAAWAS